MIIDYSRCHKCNQIVGRVGECEFCRGTRRWEWPSPDTAELLNHALTLDPGAPHGRRIGVIFSCVAFERLLEDLLYAMAFGELLYDEASLIVEALIDGYQGRSRMLSLFARIGYGTFHQQADALGFPEFPMWWNEIVAERNALVHSRQRRSSGDQKAVELEPFIHRGLQLFAALHNRYNMEATQFKTATRK
jgi:hypothetical protein